MRLALRGADINSKSAGLWSKEQFARTAIGIASFEKNKDDTIKTAYENLFMATIEFDSAENVELYAEELATARSANLRFPVFRQLASDLSFIYFDGDREKLSKRIDECFRLESNGDSSRAIDLVNTFNSLFDLRNDVAHNADVQGLEDADSILESVENVWYALVGLYNLMMSAWLELLGRMIDQIPIAFEVSDVKMHYVEKPSPSISFSFCCNDFDKFSDDSAYLIFLKPENNDGHFLFWSVDESGNRLPPDIKVRDNSIISFDGKFRKVFQVSTSLLKKLKENGDYSMHLVVLDPLDSDIRRWSGPFLRCIRYQMILDSNLS